MTLLARRLAFVPLALICLFLSGCLEQQRIADIPDAENLLFTDDGRLFVTGGRNIYEIRAEGDEYRAFPLFDGAGGLPSPDDDGNYCNTTGLVQHGDWVLAACQQGALWWRQNHLLAGHLGDGDAIRFQSITPDSDHPFNQLMLPNGMAVAPDGALLVADANFFAKAGVARIRLDMNATIPVVEEVQTRYLDADLGLDTPNGVRTTDEHLFVSNGSRVLRFDFRDDGDIDRASRRVPYKGGFGTVVDDVMPWCGGVALTHFTGGKLIYVSATTDPETGEEVFRKEIASPSFGLDFPSALAVGKGPLFGGHDLLVTEKGFLGSHFDSVGNQLSLVPMEFDLTDPATCDAVNDVVSEELAEDA